MINKINKYIIERNRKKNLDISTKLKNFKVNDSNFIDFSNKKGMKQEWPNSVYSYNNNYEKNLPILLNMAYDIIKSYFFLYSNKLEKSTGLRRLRIKSRRSKTNRIFVSRPTLKHTSTNVLITIYIYNRQKVYYNNKLKQLDELMQLIKSIESKKSVENIKNMWYIKDYETTIRNKELHNNINYINNKGLALIKKINNEKTILDKTFVWSDNNFKLFELQVFNSFLKKSLLEEIHKIYYKQLYQINKFKFQDVYLLKLKEILSKLFNKKIEFNIVNLKSFYLNSDIFTSTISLILRKRENNINKVLDKSVEIVKYNPFNKLMDLPSLYDKPRRLFSDNILHVNAKLLSKNNITNNQDIVNSFITDIFKEKNKETSRFFIENEILSNIRFKTISGINIQAKGRLTRRLIAARSVYKHKTIGSIKNVDSSYRGLYSPMLFGHSNSNVQYSRSHYKNRNGSFGIKGWISSK